jgi:hypothetical protein
MTDDLARLATLHQRHMGRPDVSETIQFLNTCINAIDCCRTQMARDRLPPSLKGATDMRGFRRRPARDALYQRNPNEPDVGLFDLTRDEETSFGSRLGEGLKRAGEGINRFSETTERNTAGDEDDDFSPEDLVNIVQLCAGKFGAQDDEDNGDRCVQFMHMLSAFANANGNGVNGDSRRRRSARDQLPNGSSGSRSPGNGIGSYGAGSSGSPTGDRRRTARDRAIAQDAAVRELNRSSFLRRFPGAARINIGGRF